MSVQFGMAIDPRDCEKEINGVLPGKEEEQGRNGTALRVALKSYCELQPTLQEDPDAETKLFAAPDFIQLLENLAPWPACLPSFFLTFSFAYSSVRGHAINR